MSHPRRVASAIVFAATLATLHRTGRAQAAPEPTNDLPNPYQTIEGWAKLPAGRTWGSTSAVDIAPDGKSIWVAERCGANSCAGSDLPSILHFDADGNLLTSFGAGMLLSPHGIFVDRAGNVWVTDCACTGGGGGRRGGGAGRGGAGGDSAARGGAGRAGGRGNADSAGRGAGRGGATGAAEGAREAPKGHQVFEFSPDGKLLRTLGTPGGAREPGYFWQPNDVLVAPSGDIYVAEGHSSRAANGLPNARVLRFSKDGALVATWGHFGTGPGEFDQPHALAMDSRGRLFVGDRGNNRIQIFTQDGKLLDTWYQFSRPSGIFIDRNDNIYVADSESGSVDSAHVAWKRGIRIGSAKDGKVTAFIPDPNENARGTSAAEGVAVDAAGHIYGAEVGPRALKRYVRKE